MGGCCHCTKVTLDDMYSVVHENSIPEELVNTLKVLEIIIA